MSSLTIHESCSLGATPEAVWRVLVDPERVVTCLPGASFDGLAEDGSLRGSVTVKLGAVTMKYRGSAVFEEVDEETRYVRVVGRGREKSGSGTVSMTMESRVDPCPEKGARLTVDARVKMAGKIVRFGRGMIQTVSAELFRDFTGRLAREATRDERSGVAEEEPIPVSLPSLLWRAFTHWLSRLFGATSD